MSEPNDTEDGVPLPPPDSVGGLARTGVRWAIASMILRQITTMATTMVVSRYVTPSETGTVVMVSNVVAFLGLFDTGLMWAIVQSQTLGRSQARELFWFGVAGGLFLLSLCAGIGPLISRFYNERLLTILCPALGVSLLFNSASTAPAALLKRSLRQRTTNLIDTMAILLSCIVGVISAILGFGYWAIVLQTICYSIARTILLLSGTHFHIGRPTISAKIMPLLRMGGVFALSNVVCYFQLYSISIIFGKMFDNEGLGNLSKAIALRTLPTLYISMVLTDIMVAALASLRSTPEKMGDAYRRVLALVALIGCPLGGLLFAMSHETVLLLYGVQWQSAPEMVRYLSLSAMMLPITTSTVWLFLAGGKAREQLMSNLLLSGITIGVYGYALLASATESTVLSIEAILSGVLFPLAGLWFSHRAYKLPVTDTVKRLVPIVSSCFVASILVYWGNAAISTLTSSLAAMILAKSFLFALVYLTGLWFTLGRSEAIRMWHSVSEVLKLRGQRMIQEPA